MKKISVVTICYNNLEGLKKTVSSVLNQRRELFEYVIIDGASTDGSQDYLQSIRENVDVLVMEKDKGIYDALNKGWRLSKGDFIIFMNAGDIFASDDILINTVPFLDGEMDIAYGDAHLSNRNGIYKTKKHPRKMNSIWMIKEVIAHQSQFIRRALLARNDGYDLQYQIASDYAFLAKVFWQQKAHFFYLPFAISVFDTEGLSSSADQKLRIEKERKVIHQLFAPWWIRTIYYSYARLNRWIGR